MKTIWKYTLLPGVPCEMPEGATPLSVAEQNGNLCLWALVDPDQPVKARQLLVVGTGHNCPDGGRRFIGTALLQKGALVLHVFDDEEATC